MYRTITIILITLFILPYLVCGKTFGAQNDNKEERINQIIEINKHFEAGDYDLDAEDIKKMGYGIDPKEKKQDLAKKYEALAIELDVEKKEAKEKLQERKQKLFLLDAKKYRGYDNFITEYMIWEESKSFYNIFIQNEKRLQPLASMINSTYLMKEIGPATSVYIGQKGLGSFDDLNVDFIRTNTTTYDVGTKIINKGEFVNFTAGAYNSVLDMNVSGGAVIASNPFIIPKVQGNFIVGGGVYGSTFQDVNINTGGLFSQYSINKLKLKGEISQSKYSNNDLLHTGVSLSPEYQLTNSLSIKTRFMKNVTQNTDLDEIGFVYKPLKYNSRDLELEINAGNTYIDSELSKQRVKFSAKFRI